MSITQKYHRAIHSQSLKSAARKGDEGEASLDTDTLAAMGFADRDLSRGYDGRGNSFRPAPLEVALERLFAGDGRQATVIVKVLAEMVWSKAEKERMKPKLSRSAAFDLACKCLAYHRNKACVACGGHGTAVFPGTNVLGYQACGECRDARSGESTGQRVFEKDFHQEHQSIARWLVTEIEREAGRAAPVAMRYLADKMEF